MKKTVEYCCIVVLLILLNSCIKEDLSGCPTGYVVKVSVKDKNYTNIGAFPQLGKVDESLPFRYFSGTVYYSVKNMETGQVVQESSVLQPSDAAEYTITLKDLPSGNYDVTVWGNAFATPLIIPVTNALYDLLLQNLVNQIGSALGGNANQSGAIAQLGILLNPWSPATASTAVVTIRNFPKTIDFGLIVKDVYTGDHTFRYNFMTESVFNEKDILIKGFNGLFDVRKIQAIGPGLVGGLLID